MAEHQHEQVHANVSVIICKDDQVLLEKRQNAHAAGTWGPPTGHIDFGETPEETAIRETREETGVEFSNLKFRAVTNDLLANENYHVVTIWMEADHAAGEAIVKAPEEESEVGWFALNALPEPLYPPFANLLSGNAYPTRANQDAIGSAGESTGSAIETIIEEAAADPNSTYPVVGESSNSDTV